MKEIKRDVTESKIFYEISEDELNKIKHDERAKGRADVAKYIDMAYCNLSYDFNIGGAMKFIKELIEFCRRERSGIENNVTYDFFDWVEKYR